MYYVITDTPRGQVTTDVPTAIDTQGPAAVDAFVAADVERQLASLAPVEILDGANPEE